MWTGFEVCIVIGRCIGAICEMRGLASILKRTLMLRRQSGIHSADYSKQVLLKNWIWKSITRYRAGRGKDS